MLDTLHQLRNDLQQHRPVAYCRLVETRGSTPQKAGAVMLVYENGAQTGTLGGGCVEAEVKRTAIRILGQGEGEIVTFQLDHDFGWDDGLICGGRMTVLIEPLRANVDTHYYESLAELVRSRGGFTEAIVFDEALSGIRAPASFLFDGQDHLVATHHAAGSASQAVADRLDPIQQNPRPYAKNGIAFLPFAPQCRLVIVGGGHIGQAVAKLAVDLDFEVWVTDDRDSYVSADRFPDVDRRIAGPCGDVLSNMEVTPDTYCLIVTRGHNHDQEALARLINRGARYVGMIGSRRKIRLIFDDLVSEGVSDEALEEVYAPVGIDIGSQTVPEIAVSIAAELVAHRNCGGRVPGRPTTAVVES